MPAVTCVCGTTFEAKSTRAVYCSPLCRKRGSRAGLRSVKSSPSPADATPAPPVDVSDVGSVTGAAISQLAKAGALESPVGLAAVKLAQLIDSASPLNGTSVAGWTKEMRAALAEATAAAPPAEDDPIDELERKRAKHRGA